MSAFLISSHTRILDINIHVQCTSYPLLSYLGLSIRSYSAVTLPPATAAAASQSSYEARKEKDAIKADRRAERKTDKQYCAAKGKELPQLCALRSVTSYNHPLYTFVKYSRAKSMFTSVYHSVSRLLCSCSTDRENPNAATTHETSKKE